MELRNLSGKCDIWEHLDGSVPVDGNLISDQSGTTINLSQIRTLVNNYM